MWFNLSDHHVPRVSKERRKTKSVHQAVSGLAEGNEPGLRNVAAWMPGAAALPKFFFDIDDGKHVLIDNLGTELPDETSAREEATKTLVDMGRDSIPGDGPKRTLRITVRGPTGGPLFELVLDFDSKPPSRG